MNAICCVHNCPTYNNENLKPTYFMLPTDHNIKKEWLKALNNLVHPNTHILSVCELHFQREDVLRVDYTLVDGKLIKLDKMTTALRKTAIPCIFNDPYPNLQFLLERDSCRVAQPLPSYTLLNGIKSILQQTNAEGNVNGLNGNNRSNENHCASSAQPNPNAPQPIADKRESSNLVDVTANNAEALSPVLQSIENVSQQEIHLMAGDKMQVINVKDFPCNLAGPVALRIKPLTNKGIESTLEPVRIMQNATFAKTTFTIYDLKSHLAEGHQMRIQSFWRYLSEDKSVLFFYVDYLGKGISRTVYIGEDLKMEIRIANHLVQSQVINTARSVEDVCRFLCMVGNMKICDELFYHTEKVNLSNKACSKLFLPKKNLAKSGTYCNECLNLRNKKAEAAKKSMTRAVELLAKKQHQQRKMQNLKSYCTHLKRKVSLMNKQMREMIRVYSSTKQKEIEEELSFLPERQREVIKTLFTSARRQPGKRKFSDQWIQESFNLYAASAKVYKYLRTREILPLPSVDTLRTYGRKLLCSNGNSDHNYQNSMVSADTFLVKPFLKEEPMDTIDLTSSENKTENVIENTNSVC